MLCTLHKNTIDCLLDGGIIASTRIIVLRNITSRPTVIYSGDYKNRGVRYEKT
jgi:hypothetical protein